MRIFCDSMNQWFCDSLLSLGHTFLRWAAWVCDSWFGATNVPLFLESGSRWFVPWYPKRWPLLLRVASRNLVCTIMGQYTHKSPSQCTTSVPSKNHAPNAFENHWTDIDWRRQGKICRAQCGRSYAPECSRRVMIHAQDIDQGLCSPSACTALPSAACATVLSRFSWKLLMWSNRALHYSQMYIRKEETLLPDAQRRIWASRHLWKLQSRNSKSFKSQKRVVFNLNTMF